MGLCHLSFIYHQSVNELEFTEKQNVVEHHTIPIMETYFSIVDTQYCHL